MFRYLCVLLCLIVMMVICFDGSVAETEDVDLAQQVEDLKERVKALSDANERLNLQIEDLYCMSQTSRIRILDEEEGSFTMLILEKIGFACCRQRSRKRNFIMSLDLLII